MLPEVFIVCGVGRSGTSTVARMLHGAGVHMGDNLFPADKDNPLGYYEDTEFLEINQDYNIRYIDDNEWRRRAQALISQRDATGKPWGMKDPRLCWIIGKYAELLGKRRTHIILCWRDPRKVVSSLQRCYGISEVEAWQTAAERYAALTANLQGLRYTVIDFTEPIEEKKLFKQIRRIIRDALP